MSSGKIKLVYWVLLVLLGTLIKKHLQAVEPKVSSRVRLLVTGKKDSICCTTKMQIQHEQKNVDQNESHNS